ncbi:MAG TPA: GNAT family N-acetyltransferase [Gaiellaceae bacterium]|nr:GNAT family N-acetyltransferase [Gaiellaceae bacterium]
MDAERFEDAGAFLAAAEPLLLADEARHNLLLGIAGTIRDAPDLYPENHLVLVRDGDRPVAAALRTPPYNLVLAKPESDEALAVLLDAVAGEDLPGVVGSVPESEAFAGLWAPRAGVTARFGMRQGVYALERVEPLPPADGAARVATIADRKLVLRWWVAFGEEVLHEGGPGRDRAEATVDYRLSSPATGILLWEDEAEPVSLAGWGGATPNGIRVGPVYTPPELRGHGYATAVTAELSRRLLDSALGPGGRRFCFLYTDLANPTSNAIYERIGYRRVCESAEILFDRPG